MIGDAVPVSADQRDDGGSARFVAPTGPRPAQASNEAGESASVRAVSTRFARSTTGGSEAEAEAARPGLTRSKQNPRHVEARRGFLGPL